MVDQFLQAINKRLCVPCIRQTQRTNAKYITKRFGIVSDRNRGEFNYNVLQDGASELFILTEKDTNILDISKTFMDRSPIRAVANNDIMLTYDLPYYHIVN